MTATPPPRAPEPRAEPRFGAVLARVLLVQVIALALLALLQRTFTP